MRQMKEITVQSSLDASVETCLLDIPDSATEIPLVVGLHTWSCGRLNQVETMLPFTRRLGWGLLLPEFRGPNLSANPRATEACGSPLARQDIVDAVEQVLANTECLDSRHVFLLGGSGGGHMALLMAAYRPDLWCRVSSWCPITDLNDWHRENGNYRKHIEACCGGTPAEQAAAYSARSPVSYLQALADSRTWVYHGKWDPSVPFTHSLKLYNQLLDIRPDAELFLTIFDGGHELHYEVAFANFQQAWSRTKANTLSA